MSTQLDEILDLLGCPLCNQTCCHFPAIYKALEIGHIINGRYVLYNEKDQYLLFTAGLQMIRLAPIARLR